MSKAVIIACSLGALCLLAATRPRYGGTLRVELREAVAVPDPPSAGPGIADLFHAFTITRWEGGKRAAFVADESAAGGRPFLDGVEVDLGRGAREQIADLNLGRADIVQLALGELPRPQAGRRVWQTAPIHLVALQFQPRVDDARVREALAFSIDRDAIHRVLLQRLGEVSGGLLPQWLSGFAFLFPSTADLNRARGLLGSVPAPGRTLSLSVDDPALRSVADRIVLNARDVGLAVTVVPPGSAADVKLVDQRLMSPDAPRALAILADALALPAPPKTETPESLYFAERSLLEGYRVIPLFHLPDVYLVGPRVKGTPGITPMGEWRFENLWLEGGRP